MPFFSKVFKHRDAASAIAKKHAMLAESTPAPVYKPRYASTWESTEVVLDEVVDLMHACTAELKSRAHALDTPFLLLPFRPESDHNSAQTFIHAFFKSHREGSMDYRGEALQRELRLTGTDDLCCIIKWIWSRIPQGVVSWNVYASFKDGEKESGMVIDSFDAFIPISVDTESRKNLIYDFFDLLSVIAAHGKVNGMGGRKLSRMAGWWAFEQSDAGKGFVGGYKSWTDAADAASHLFFAYLRSRAPEAVNGITGISNLPRSLQALVSQTEYPPQRPAAMQSSTAKVLMVVDAVSPTPFALLRRARLFDYRADDRALNQFVEYADPVNALTEECKRVLEAISSTNQSSGARSRRATQSSARVVSNFSMTAGEDPWSRFQDEGFSSSPVDSATQSPQAQSPVLPRNDPSVFTPTKLQAAPRSRPRVGRRPTTPSWADFLNSGFMEEGNANGANGHFLPPEQHLPPVVDRDSLSGSPDEDELEPGELASINRFELDESFWWVWMTSLSAEETSVRKAAFGRCALVETSISGGRWLLLEEQVKGASQNQSDGVYIAEKKSRSLFTRRHRSTRKKNAKGEAPATPRLGYEQEAIGSAKANLTPDQRAKISAAAAVIARQHRPVPEQRAATGRGYLDDTASIRPTSMMTVGLTADASPAMQWANAYDKEAIRQQYLGDNYAGKGLATGIPISPISTVAGQSHDDPFVKKPDEEPAPPQSAKSSDKSVAPGVLSSPTMLSEGDASPNQRARGKSITRKPVSPKSEKHIHPAFRTSLVGASEENVPLTATAGQQEISSPLAAKKLQKRPQGVSKKFVVKRKEAPPVSPTKDAEHSPPRTATNDPTANAAVVNVQPQRPQRRAVREMIKNLETTNTPPPASTPLSDQRFEQRFDQGPLDAPAFVPRASLDTDDGSPVRVGGWTAHNPVEEDGETSEEESMEERVARIKARVAALTGIDRAQHV